MKDVLAVVLAGGRGERLGPLTRDRAKPAVPFGGIYRIIDFTLSNCLNSGLRRILVLTQYKAMSLDRHITLGWRNYLCRELGEFIDVVPPQQRIDDKWYQGTADAVYQNIYTLEKERPEYVVILAGDHIYKMDYAQAGRVPPGEERRPDDRRAARAGQGVARTSASCRSTPRAGSSASRRSRPMPKTIPGNPEYCLASMGIYVFNARFLFDQLCRDATLPDSAHDFGRNIIPSLVGDAAGVCVSVSRRESQAGRLLARRRHDRLVLPGEHRAHRRRAAVEPVRRPLAGADVSAEPAAAEVRVQLEGPLRRGARQHRVRRRDHLGRQRDADDRRPANPRQQLRRGRGLDHLFRREHRPAGEDSPGDHRQRRRDPRRHARSASTRKKTSPTASP